MEPELVPRPLISIVTITLNDREGLARTIESLKAQRTPPSFEHIIVDGMSDYDVPSLLENLGWHGRLHQGRDTGLYDAMNRGTDLSRGEYVLYLNRGDELAAPDVLGKTGSTLVQQRPDFFWGDSLERQLGGELRYKPSRPLKHLPLGMITHHQAMLFRRDLLEKHAIRYNLHYKIAADYEFVLRHTRVGVKFSYLPEPICIFELGGTSYQQHNDGRIEQFQIRKEVYGSTSFAAVIYVAQWSLRKFRGMFPMGYWVVRRLFG